MSTETKEWLGCPVTLTMLRKDFTCTDIKLISKEVSEWLGCKPEFIEASFSTENSTDTDVKKKRYFERYHQRHATVVLEL